MKESTDDDSRPAASEVVDRILLLLLLALALAAGLVATRSMDAAMGRTVPTVATDSSAGGAR